MEEDRLRDLTNQKDTHVHVVNVTQKVSQRGGNSGCLSLIGGTVVVLIVLAMIPGLLDRISSSDSPSEPKYVGDLTEQYIGVLETALKTFRLDVGRYPSNEEGLMRWSWFVGQSEGGIKVYSD